ncbi:MAG: hypothetical protein KDJ36_01045 [Hyphomicrobiaceae bacterium]|nr:hypothetical protein [Hyphomicrobiaceae bacterium]
MLRLIRSTPLPIVLVIVSFICPTELSLYVAGLRLPPHRIALLILIPFAVSRMVASPEIRIRGFDIFFLLYNAWTVAAFVQHGEGNGGLVFGGSLALESFGAYIVARAWIRSAETFVTSLQFLALTIFVSGLLALPETLLGKHFTHDLLQSLTGYDHPRKIETRMRLTRAYGTFDHPIHLGTFAATAFAMIWFTTRPKIKRWQRAVMIGVVTLSALSSAPILCLFSQIGLIVWERVTRGMEHRVITTVVGGTSVLLVISLLSDRSPFAWIATGMTIDSWTGYYRLLIWEHGLLNVWAHPWLGLGLGEWERPWWMASASVDAFWLLIAMRTGVPSFLLLAIAIALLLAGVARRGARNKDAMIRNTTKAWVISLIALVLVGCTVHYWNALHAYFFFFLGLAGWVADPKRRRAKSTKRLAPRAAPEPPMPVQYPLPGAPLPAH